MEETENPALAAILGQRQQEYADLYKEAGSILAGIAKKRKKTGAEDGVDLKVPEAPYDPVEASFKERNTIMADAASILDEDPEAKRIRKIQPENRPETFGRFMNRKSEHSRNMAAARQKRTQGEVEDMKVQWPPIK